MKHWNLVQQSAIQILSDGLHELLRQPYRRLDAMVSPIPGNYLISLDKKECMQVKVWILRID